MITAHCLHPLRHKGQSIGEVIADTMGSKAKKLFIVFAYLT